MSLNRVSFLLRENMHSFGSITTVFERDIGPAHFRKRKHPISLCGITRK